VQPPVDPILLLRDPVKILARGKDNGKKGRRELIQVEHARNATAATTARETKPAWDYTKVPREFVWNRSMEDLIQHLPKLASGPSFHRVVPNEVTENKGPEELFPEPYWVDELWHEEVRVAPETYRLYLEISRWRNRRIQELLFWREDRADAEAMREAARQAYRAKQLQQEAREEVVAQGLRRSERGHIPLRRSREP
jgi:hypothetical protein